MVTFPNDAEGISIELNLRKVKLPLFSTYDPSSKSDEYYFSHIGNFLTLSISHMIDFFGWRF